MARQLKDVVSQMESVPTPLQQSATASTTKISTVSACGALPVIPSPHHLQKTRPCARPHPHPAPYNTAKHQVQTIVETWMDDMTQEAQHAEALIH
jgi:hypothetical protein